MSDAIPAPADRHSEAEAAVLAREFAASFGKMLRRYREYFRQSPEQALQHTEALIAAEHFELTKNTPPDQLSWFDLNHLAQHDEALALERWGEIYKAACQELQTGHRTAFIMEAGAGSPWERAQFLALREELSRDWQPRNGVERQLIDTMAQAQSSYFTWLQAMTVRTRLDAKCGSKLREQEKRWEPPRQSAADAMEQAGAMADRFNRIFLRTLRALRDLRRYAPVVVVQNAGQVNIGEKQVNVH